MLDRALYDDHAVSPDQWNLARTVFETTTIDQFMAPIGLFDMIQKKPFTGAKNEEFIVIADDGVSEPHEPGSPIVGQAMEKTNRIISLEDREEIVYYNISKLDQFVAHYDQQAKAGQNVGRALRRTCENQAFRLAQLAAATSAEGAFKGGQTVTRSAANIAAAYPMTMTGSKNAQADIASLQRLFHADHVPDEMETYLFCSKWFADVLRQDQGLLSRDYSDAMLADRLKAKLMQVENTWIMPSLYIPTAGQEATASASVTNADFSADASRTINGTGAYMADCRKLVAVVLKVGPAGTAPDGSSTSITSGLGCLMAENIATEIEKIPGTRSWNIGGAMYKGMGILRPELVGTIMLA